MIVHVLTKTNWDDSEIIGVYPTPEAVWSAAEKYNAAGLCVGYGLESCEVEIGAAPTSEYRIERKTYLKGQDLPDLYDSRPHLWEPEPEHPASNVSREKIPSAAEAAPELNYIDVTPLVLEGAPLEEHAKIAAEWPVSLPSGLVWWACEWADGTVENLAMTKAADTDYVAGFVARRAGTTERPSVRCLGSDPAP